MGWKEQETERTWAFESEYEMFLHVYRALKLSHNGAEKKRHVHGMFTTSC